jgi:hypothetical protein
MWLKMRLPAANGSVIVRRLPVAQSHGQRAEVPAQKPSIAYCVGTCTDKQGATLREDPLLPLLDNPSFSAHYNENFQSTSILHQHQAQQLPNNRARGSQVLVAQIQKRTCAFGSVSV